jgi:hypothetical protein
MNPERGVAKKTTILSNPPKNRMRRGFGLQLDFSIRGRNIAILTVSFDFVNKITNTMFLDSKNAIIYPTKNGLKIEGFAICAICTVRSANCKSNPNSRFFFKRIYNSTKLMRLRDICLKLFRVIAFKVFSAFSTVWRRDF